jgi:hypothetical protein
MTITDESNYDSLICIEPCIPKQKVKRIIIANVQKGILRNTLLHQLGL